MLRLQEFSWLSLTGTDYERQSTAVSAADSVASCECSLDFAGQLHWVGRDEVGCPASGEARFANALSIGEDRPLANDFRLVLASNPH